MELYQPQLQCGGKVYLPGVYDISIEEYHTSAGISRSGIAELRKTPKHYWDKYINPNRPAEKKKKCFELGTAVHTYLIERDKFEQGYIIEPKFSGKGSKANKAKFREENKGKKFITNADLAKVKAIASEIENHKSANDLIKGAIYEKSIYWIDGDTGLLCKARPDIWHANLLADIKTTECAEYYKFEGSVTNYDYYIQAAMCLDAVRERALEEHDNFFFIAVETERPHVTF
jgi:exodeoxyribonuclease VIII